MDEESFYISRLLIWIAWAGLPVAVLGFIVSLLGQNAWSPSSLFIGIFSIAFFLRILLRRSRPFITVSDEAVEWESVIGFSKKRSVSTREIRAVRFKNPRTLCIETRPGKTITVRLGEIARSQRQALREAIERRVASLGQHAT